MVLHTDLQRELQGGEIFLELQFSQILIMSYPSFINYWCIYSLASSCAENCFYNKYTSWDNS